MTNEKLIGSIRNKELDVKIKYKVKLISEDKIECIRKMYVPKSIFQYIKLRIYEKLGKNVTIKFRRIDKRVYTKESLHTCRANLILPVNLKIRISEDSSGINYELIDVDKHPETVVILSEND